jgi:SAM-dependent methyltransferase
LKLVSLLRKSKTIEKNIRHHKAGYCHFCGKVTVFLRLDNRYLRNDLVCPLCGSISRNRHVAKALCEIFKKRSIKEFANDKSIKLYNTDIRDSFDHVLGKSSNYVKSALMPEVPLGTRVDERTYCQDIHQLTFPDESFDVVISQDVFGHVRHHEKALKEIWRVLKNDGLHIFTVPIDLDNNTITRIDTSGEKDVFLLPPQYHTDALRADGIIVYRNFGKDITEMLTRLGFDAKLDISKPKDTMYGIYETVVIVTRKSLKKN